MNLVILANWLDFSFKAPDSCAFQLRVGVHCD